MALFKVVAGAVNGGAGNPGQVVECMEGEQFLASDLLVEKVRVPVRPGQVARLVISLQTNPLGAAESVTFSVAVDGVSSAQTITVVPATPLNTPQTMGVSPVVAVGSARLSLLANAAAFTSVADPLRFTASWEYQPTTFNG